MIWGLPGMCDGYGLELADFYHLDEYLAYINLTYADYTDIPEERPHPVSSCNQHIALSTCQMRVITLESN